MYLKKTSSFRSSDGEKTGFFLSVNEPYNPVTSQTIFKWLVQLIKLAYTDFSMKVRGHFTRAIGPSWALYNGASVKRNYESS